MAQSDINGQIRAAVESFVHELTGLVRSAAIDSVSAALGGGQATRAARAPSRAPRAASGGRNRRASDQIEKTSSRLQDYIKGHPGQGMEQIKKALNMSTKNLRLPVRKLLAARKVKVTGQKRATRYFAT
jgi:hypothetical protein